MDKYPMLDLTKVRVDFPIEFNYIKDIAIYEQVNAHGKLEVELVTSSEVTSDDLVRLENSKILVYTLEGEIIFSGDCTNIGITHENQHCRMTISALGHTANADIVKKNRTFQDTSKTLSQVAKEVLISYGVSISIPNDINIPQVLSQKNETDFEFVKRVANQYGYFVFANNKSGFFSISIGALPFGTIEKDLGNPTSITKDINTYLAVKKNINAKCNLFEFFKKTFRTFDLTLGVGYGITGDSRLMIVTSSNIVYQNGELVNEIELSYVDGLYYTPISEPQSTEADKSNPNSGSVLSGPDVLTGSVVAVDGNNIQVSFYSEKAGASTRWISYNSFFGLDFYCMPDIGDTVFCYYENEGDIICLGSKHVNNSHPDFSNPEHKVFTANNSMIMHKKDGTDFTANRNEMDGYGGKQVKITLSEQEGISVVATQDINIISDSKIIFQTNDLDVVNEDKLKWFNESYGELTKRFTEEYSDGENYYRDNCTTGYSAMLSLGSVVGQNLAEGAKGMIEAPFELVTTLFGKEPEPPEEVPLIQFEEINTYQINVFGMNELTISTGNSIFKFTNNTIDVNTAEIKWLGLNQQSGYPVVSESQQSFLDTMLDVMQVGIDLIGLIPGCNVVCGAINTVVSLARGDYFGALCGLATMALPGAGAVMRGTKIATTVVDKVADSAKLIKTLKYFAAGSQVINSAGMAIISTIDNIDVFTQGGWTQEDWDALAQIGGHIVGAVSSGQDINDTRKMQGNTRLDNQPDQNSNGHRDDTPDTTPDNATPTPPNTTAHADGNQTTCNDPIDVVTGSQKIVQKDLVIYDLLGDFAVERTYQSIYTNKHTLLGSKWHINIGSWLSRTGDAIRVMMPSMRVEEFSLTDEIWVNNRKDDYSVTLLENNDGYDLKLLSQNRVYNYDINGKLQYISDDRGNKIKFAYQGKFLTKVDFPSSQSLSISYSGDYIAKITDHTGRSVRYSYDKNYLKEVVYPNKGVVEYFYTEEGYLSSIIDQRGCEYVKNFYDNAGRVTRQLLSNGQEFIMLYDDKNRVNISLKPLTGEKTTYYYNHKELVTKIEYHDGTYEEFAYDKNFNKCEIRDKSGNIVKREYNDFGCLLKEELPNGLVIISSYDDEHRLIERRDNADGCTKFYYDNYKNVIQIDSLVSEGVWQSVSFRYDSLGRMTTYTMANGENITYFYQNKDVKPSRIVTAIGNEYLYEIDELQRQVSIQNIHGTTKYAYNDHNFLSYVIDPLENYTQYFYDKLGNLIHHISPKGYLSDGKSIGIEYTYDDFDELIKKTDELGNIYATPRDVEGNIVKEINPNTYDNDLNDGLGICYEYNIFDKKTKIIFPDSSVERIKYDNNDNIIKVIKAEQYNEETDDGLGFTYEYDNVNRLTKIISPSGMLHKAYDYDLKGNILKETDSTGYAKLYKYNVIGWFTEKREPVKIQDGYIDYRLVTYEYDISGNMIKENRYIDFQSESSYDGEVHTICFEYDKENRRTKVSDNTGAVMEYSYNAIGQVTLEKRKVNTNVYNTTNYIYDNAGRLIEVRVSTNEKDAVTKYEYDKNGNITKITTPSGNMILREYDLCDRIISETHKENSGNINNRTAFAYDKAGNLISITDNQGRKTEIQYDLLNREIRTKEKDGSITRKFYDKNSNLSKVVRPNQYDELTDNGKGYSYTYNERGQVLTIVSPTGSILQSNTYDDNGNLITQVDGQNSGVDFTYDLSGNRLNITTKGGASQDFEYDARGNIIGIVDGEKNRTGYTLDKWGRITTIQKADGSHERYTYDYAGNMLSSTDGEGYKTEYEYTKTGQVSKIIDPMGEFESYAYDEENRLKRKVDRNGNVIDLAYNMYGNITSKTALNSDLFEKFTYSVDGMLESAISNGMHYSYTYDVMNRLASKESSGRTLIAYEYDKNGNKIKETSVTGNVTETTYVSVK